MKHKRVSAIQKATQKLRKEGDRQCHLIYGAACIVFYRYWGWRTERITRLMDLTSDVWNECAKDTEVSMIEMLERETGIEIQNGNGKSWHDLPYLNAKLDMENMTEAKVLYMRQQEITWMAPLITSCLLLALHRKYGFGYDRGMRVYTQIKEIQDEFGMDPKKIKEACLKETKINITDKINEKPKQ